MMKLLVPLALLASPLTSPVWGQSQNDRTSLFKTGLLGWGVEIGYYSKSQLLGRPEVRAELELTDAQVARLTRAERELEAESARQGQENQRLLRRLRAQGDTAGYAAFLASSAASTPLLTRELEIPLLKVLDRRQRSRLEEIQLQADGPIAFTRPDVQDALNLWPDQMEMIQAILAEGRETINRAATVPSGIGNITRGLKPEQRTELLKSKTVAAEVEKSRTAVVRARDLTTRSILRILSKRQRATYERMLGKRFEFAKPKEQPPVSN